MPHRRSLERRTYGSVLHPCAYPRIDAHKNVVVMMMTAPVVVGIDGSRAALSAAVWAADEAAKLHVPLHLIYAFERDDENIDQYAIAETALRHARSVVEAMGNPPAEIEAHVVRQNPVAALVKASQWARMVCVGVVGLHHFADGHVGSTAATLAAQALCPVTVVRNTADTGCVVVVMDESAESINALRLGVEQAVLRQAPLRVLLAWHPHTQTGADGNRMARAKLERLVAQWRWRYPDLDVTTVTVQGNAIDYLAENAAQMQLMVVGGHNRDNVGQMLGPQGAAALHGSDCSLLIADSRRRL